jgi:two-component system sensor histidine kinase ChvG
MMKDEALMSSLRYKKINIQDLLKNIINEYKDINHKQLNFKLIQDNNINNNIVVRGHEEFIKRAIHNIYDNAISFSVDKGTIETTLSVASNYVTLAISDNGPGITELNIENIFNRFYTYRNASNEFSSTHSGLGLHIARQIIETHKGNIRAENLSKNNLLSGSRFIINLPIIIKK